MRPLCGGNNLVAGEAEIEPVDGDDVWLLVGRSKKQKSLKVDVMTGTAIEQMNGCRLLSHDTQDFFCFLSSYLSRLSGLVNVTGVPFDFDETEN